MNKNTLFLLAGAGLAMWYLAKSKPLTRLEMINYLNNWADHTGDTESAIDHYKVAVIQMTDQEMTDTYTFIHDYFEKGNKPVPPGSALQLRLVAISNKYNIFT